MPDYFCQVKICEIACQSRAFFSANQRSKTETDVMVTCSPAFSRASYCLHLFASRYNWFID